MLFQKEFNWCVECHANTNHYYDLYLPYEFHLRMAYQVYLEFKHLLPVSPYFVDEQAKEWEQSIFTWFEVIEKSVGGHDLEEDTRKSFNDIAKVLGIHAARIIHAVTNEKGTTRAERANAKYYQGIRETKGADFVKLCDRIANVRYAKLTKSRQFKMYSEENNHFLTNIGNNYPEMNNHLISLFNS